MVDLPTKVLMPSITRDSVRRGVIRGVSKKKTARKTGPYALENAQFKLDRDSEMLSWKARISLEKDRLLAELQARAVYKNLGVNFP